MPRATVIAIDGPVASGKTAIGRILARRLGYRCLDTGLLYRAVAWVAMEAGADLDDADLLVRLVQEQQVEVVFDDFSEASILVSGRNLMPYLEQPEVAEGASQVAQVPGVRQALLALQRRIGREDEVVMMGRDIGTVVLPDAPLKVFLTASVKERARRRYLELQAQEEKVDFPQVLEELEQRDRRDSERAVAPLRPAEDAQVVETDGLSVQDVVKCVIDLLERPE